MEALQGNHIETNIVIPRKEYDELKAENLRLRHELAQLKRMIFGSRSERFIPIKDGQLALGFEIEEAPKPEPEKETITYSREKQDKLEKKGHSRLELPAHLPRIEEIIEPKEDITGAEKIGETVTEVLEYEPGKLYVIKIIRPKYKLAQSTKEETKIVTGELPSLPIPRGIVGAGLLAFIFLSKYVDHIPFYRQVQQFKRQGIRIAETSIQGWFKAICKQLESLYIVHKQLALKSSYIQSDETPIKVKSSEKVGSSHKGFFWAYNFPLEKMVLFEYSKSRGRETPEQFLESFSGTLQTDGYNVYDIFEKKKDIILLGCMAHARRKFDEALSNDKDKAEQALKFIQELYSIERKIKEQGLNFEQIKELRQKHAVPVLNEFKQWLDKNLNETLPKSVIGQAISYTLSLWNRLIRYVEDGKYKIDNNLIENSIRPIAVGRKNYLFAGSHEAAQRAAMMYSFFGTCKINNINPYEWLKNIIERLPDCKQSELENLLPHKWVKH